VAAVHRHQVHVHVDQQVGLGRPLGDLDVLAVLGLAQVGQVRGVLGVEVVELAVGEEGPEDPLADDVAQLVRGQPAVQRVRRDQLDVVHTGVGRHRQDGLDDALPDVRLLHRRQRDGNVVERDRQPHPGAQQLRQRLGLERVQQRVLDRFLDVPHRRQRLRRVHHPGAERETLQQEALTVVHEQRRCPVVHLKHKTWPRHVKNPLVVRSAPS
jgi:hypothetical protein